jgi:GT2 family glycosyltransferase
MLKTVDCKPLSIYVLIATLGRAQVLCKVLERLAAQTRLPDGIVVAGVTSADVAGVAQSCPSAEIILSAKGSCRQRNVALDHLAGKADVVIVMDDDFVAAHDYVEQVERMMSGDETLVGLTGHLLADGAHSGEIAYDVAVRELETGVLRADLSTQDTTWLYGCNMVFRLTAAPELRFDEQLPLYGWQEDVDFSCRLGRLGRMVRSRELTGVHLGTRSGRTSGLRFGYSQVANIVYLRRKQTIAVRHGFGLMARNIASNLMRSLWPEPHIDRRGRLAGNALALVDCLRGRVDPRRIESL